MLANFHLWLLFLACVNRRLPDTEPTQRLVRLHLGPLARWPTGLLLLAPWASAALLWLVAQPALAQMGLVPEPASWLQAVIQAALVGLGVMLSWKYLVCGMLALHILNSQVYLGDFGFWRFVHATAANLVRPLRRIPLRMGRVDLAPPVALVLAFIAGEAAARALTVLFVGLTR
jgi:uncharacterized protein YggT (Ycf19 family)